ncbi:MAG: preprotein translocase subunit YajC [Myxococcales bacterium]|nr:preprotein translocase subunit YajC [Myxococcales bacterium]
MNGATGGLPVVGHGHGEGLAGVLLQAQPAPFDPSFLFMMGSVFLIFYLLVFRPESKRRKEQEAQIKAATKGDEITTSGGIRGVISGETDDVVTVDIATLKSGERVRVKIARSSIASVAKADATDGGKKKGGES